MNNGWYGNAIIDLSSNISVQWYSSAQLIDIVLLSIETLMLKRTKRIQLCIHIANNGIAKNNTI